MTTISELPYDIINIILTIDGSDVRMIGRVVCVCKYFKNNNHTMDNLINTWFGNKFPYFGKLLKIENIKDTDINLHYLSKLLVNLHRVSKLAKRVKYQHLLVGCYNATLFRMKKNEFILKPEDDMLHHLESRTFSLLMTVFCYVKIVLPKDKTDLDVWAIYPLFEYAILNMEDENRKDDSIFADGFIMKDKARETRHRLQFANASQDIKYRLSKLLNYLDPELSSDDDADY